MQQGRAVQFDEPTQNDAIEEYRKFAPKLAVYNASPEWFTIEYGGIMYHLPPDLNGELVDHPVEIERYPGSNDPKLDDAGNFRPIQVVADGVLKVGDFFGKHYDKFGKFTRVGVMDGHAAFDTVVFMQRSFGNRGICWLRGEAKDEDRKRNAKALWRQHIRVWAAGEVSARQEFVANWKRMPGNKNIPPPPPTEAQSKAQEIMDGNDQEVMSSGFTCVLCYGYSSKEFPKFAQHMMRAHKKAVTLEEYGAIEPDDDDDDDDTGDEPVRRKRGRPRKNA